MYPLLLTVHSLLRWVVIAAGFVVVARALAGARARREWTARDDRLGALFVATLDVQLLIGMALYLAFSPMTQIAFQDFGEAMRTSALRFWAVEHIFGMLVAVALAHIGRVRARRALDARRRHRVTALFVGLALLAVLATIPWPGMPAGRPLFRGF